MLICFIKRFINNNEFQFLRSYIPYVLINKIKTNFCSICLSFICGKLFCLTQVHVLVTNVHLNRSNVALVCPSLPYFLQTQSISKYKNMTFECFLGQFQVCVVFYQLKIKRTNLQYLQCTTIGPSEDVISFLTKFLKKISCLTS